MICEDPSDADELLFNCNVLPRPGSVLDLNGKKIHLFRCAYMPTPYRSVGPRQFRKHAEKSALHQTATVMTSHFKQIMEQKSQPMDVQFRNIVSDQVKRNREKLLPIVGAVILCGRQNIPLRGHRDNSKYYHMPGNNPGNLQEILKFLSRFGQNSVFEEHLQNAPKSATYRSKTIQNELISVCEDMILSKLTAEIKTAKFFAVLADEAADISNKEQMSLVIRFVDENSAIRETFLSFLQCDDGLTGEAISKQIVNGVENLSIDMHLCRGQGYDGAGNMAGKCSGAAARIKQQYPNAPYVHCGSHVLNLCVASACTIQAVGKCRVRVLQ